MKNTREFFHAKVELPMWLWAIATTILWLLVIGRAWAWLS